MVQVIVICIVGSKPTAWDGDGRAKILISPYCVVPSPPCGMVTGERLGFILLRHSVLSPPCGMVTLTQIPYVGDF